ncbi:hypothetical protein RRG08_048770 [Elysia crispata]|uniref:Uncharacterized protein n=1 Tax=Elysia crispata TaxID=231223 RepID=A0AAE1AMS9_9GAST|nr:hypothetical protein RRG08_048770 [Elysia crispata]
MTFTERKSEISDDEELIPAVPCLCSNIARIRPFIAMEAPSVTGDTKRASLIWAWWSLSDEALHSGGSPAGGQGDLLIAPALCSSPGSPYTGDIPLQ